MSRPSTYHSPKTLRSLSDLIEAELIPPGRAPALQAVVDRYQTAITPVLADLIDRTDAADPIARQFVPTQAELETTPDELSDPIGDDVKSPLPGLVHRYPDRVLLKPLLVCPVYCRFCFRRDSVGSADGTMSPDQIQAAVEYIAAHPKVREVILTGGDPLMLHPEQIRHLSHSLSGLANVEVIRWHSRVPIAAPQRITAELAALLAQPFDRDKAVWVSVHCNHPRELGEPARQAIAHLRRAGLALVSQTVLLKGVNDQAQILETLFRDLVRLGVKPYYLHHADMAPGTGHFRLSIRQGQDLVRQLRGRLTGIAQPTYVLDIPGGAGKSPLNGDYWDADHGQIVDWQGNAHTYRSE